MFFLSFYLFVFSCRSNRYQPLGVDPDSGGTLLELELERKPIAGDSIQLYFVAPFALTER